MAKKRLDTDEAFLSIIGKTAENTDKMEIPKSDILANTEISKDKLIQTSFYITERHKKALKIKTALSQSPEHKDLSSIVRSALDNYLADILKDMTDIR